MSSSPTPRTTSTVARSWFPGCSPRIPVSVLSLGFDPGEFLIDDVAGPVDNLYFEGVLIGGISGGTGSTLDVTFNANATSNAIDALIQNLTYLDSSSNPTFSRTLSLNVTDAGAGSTGPNPITVKVFNGVIETGGAGDDSFTHHRQRAHRRRRRQRHGHLRLPPGRCDGELLGQSGDHRRSVEPHRALGVREVRVHRRHGGQQRRRPAGRRPVLLFALSRRVERACGCRRALPRVRLARGPRSERLLLDRHLSVGQSGREGGGRRSARRISTLSGWKEGRVPSLDFDPRAVSRGQSRCRGGARRPARALSAVRRGGGPPAVRAERPGRPPTASTTSTTCSTIPTWPRRASIRCSTSSTSAGTRAAIRTRCSTSTAILRPTATWRRRASIRSITTTFGWHGGRDPSVGFDTNAYLAAYADVAARSVNPLAHFLKFGMHEGRSPFADGVWG